MNKHIKRSLTICTLALMTLGVGGALQQSKNANTVNAHADSELDQALYGTGSKQMHENYEIDQKDQAKYDKVVANRELYTARHDPRDAETLRTYDPSVYKAHKVEIMNDLKRFRAEGKLPKTNIKVNYYKKAIRNKVHKSRKMNKHIRMTKALRNDQRLLNSHKGKAFMKLYKRSTRKMRWPKKRALVRQLNNKANRKYMNALKALKKAHLIK